MLSGSPSHYLIGVHGPPASGRCDVASFGRGETEELSDTMRSGWFWFEWRPALRSVFPNSVPHVRARALEPARTRYDEVPVCTRRRTVFILEQRRGLPSDDLARDDTLSAPQARDGGTLRRGSGGSNRPRPAYRVRPRSRSPIYPHNHNRSARIRSSWYESLAPDTGSPRSSGERPRARSVRGPFSIGASRSSGPGSQLPPATHRPPSK